MNKTLQEIEDYYIRMGFRGSRLRQVLEKDSKYQKLLSSRRKKLRKRFKITGKDEKRYVLSTDSDYEILNKIYKLEKKKLNNEDKRLVKFIRTQLEYDWRRPINELLDRLLKKYS